MWKRETQEVFRNCEWILSFNGFHVPPLVTMPDYSNLVEAKDALAWCHWHVTGIHSHWSLLLVTWRKKNVADLRILGAKRTSNRVRLVENRKCSKCTPIENRRCNDKIYDHQHQTTVKFYKNIFLRSSWEFLVSCSPIAIEQLMRKFFEVARVWKKWRKFQKHARFCCIEPERNVVLNAFNCINQNSTFNASRKRVLPTFLVKLFDFQI